MLRLICTGFLCSTRFGGRAASPSGRPDRARWQSNHVTSCGSRDRIDPVSILNIRRPPHPTLHFPSSSIELCPPHLHRLITITRHLTQTTPTMSGRTVAQVAGITALTAVTGLLGYAIYFDYQRRNNPEFRKGISG